jgi:prevent-host-death family protein
MSSEKHIGIEDARKTLGDLVTAARYGHTTVITRNGKPAARIVPIEEPAMPEHFTAWLTTDPTCMEQDQTCADVLVLADELDGEDPGNPDHWTSTTDEHFKAMTTVDAVDGDHADAKREANELLEDAGWKLDGQWEGVDSGYVVTVVRA